MNTSNAFASTSRSRQQKEKAASRLIPTFPHLWEMRHDPMAWVVTANALVGLTIVIILILMVSKNAETTEKALAAAQKNMVILNERTERFDRIDGRLKQLELEHGK